MKRRTYGFLNLGRDKNPTKSSWRLDRAALNKIKAALPDENFVVFFAEIGEGDDNEEMDLIQRVFPACQLRCTGTREPILLSPDIEVVRSHVQWLPKTAVRRWSPTRSVNTVTLVDEVLRTFHPAAGPHTVGKRPIWARRPLRKSWNISSNALILSDRATHVAGKNLTEMFDANHYNYPLVGVGQVQPIHARTDYGRAWAAAGYTANFRGLSPVEIGLDSHDFQRMVGVYTKGDSR